MELTKEKSEELAERILYIRIMLESFDLEYCRHVAAEFSQQANRQESILVLNPGHIMSKNDLLRAQGNALKKLCEYVDALKKVDEMKARVNKEQATRNDVARMFW